MTAEIWVAIIVAAASLGGSILVYLKSAKKDEVDALRGIIKELKEYVEDLERDKEDLQVWAEQLVRQIKDAGIEPARFVRSGRKPREC